MKFAGAHCPGQMTTTGHAMEWLGLHFTTSLPESGQVILNFTHDRFLVLLAYLVACVGCFATPGMAERVAHAEHPVSKRRWRWVGTVCMAGGIWAMHLIGILALQSAIDIHYHLPVTLLSLITALCASWLAMNTFALPDPTIRQCVESSTGAGLGIAAMHYMGMFAGTTRFTGSSCRTASSPSPRPTA